MCEVVKLNTDTAGPKEKTPFLMMFIIKLSLIKPLRGCSWFLVLG